MGDKTGFPKDSNIYELSNHLLLGSLLMICNMAVLSATKDPNSHIMHITLVSAHQQPSVINANLDCFILLPIFRHQD